MANHRPMSYAPANDPGYQRAPSRSGAFAKRVMLLLLGVVVTCIAGGVGALLAGPIGLVVGVVLGIIATFSSTSRVKG